MSNPKTLLFPAEFLHKFDLSDYPNMTLHEYSKLDVEITKSMYQPFFKVVLKPKKVKHNSAFRTVSNRKWAGHKNNKPKYNWGKKRRARGGWKV